MAAEEQRAPVRVPADIAARFAATWNDADVDSLASLFIEDADFVNVVGLWWRSRDRIRAAHEYGFRKIFGDSHMTLTRTAVRRLSENAAVVHAAWKLTGQRPQAPEERGGDVADDAESPAARSGVISFVVQQSDGQWLAVSAHNTDRIPGAETYIAGEGGLRAAAYQSLGVRESDGDHGAADVGGAK